MTGSRVRFRFVLAFPLALLALGSSASDPARAAQLSFERVVPAPSECTIAPRTVVDLLALADERENFGVGTPWPTPAARLEVVGMVESPAFIADIEVTLRGVVACTNAGDILRQYVYYSDDLLRGRVDLDPSGLQAAPEPRAEQDRMAILGIPYVVELADGRVGAVAVFDDPRAFSPVQPFFPVFAETDQGWVFDEWPDPYILTAEASHGEVHEPS